MSGGALDYVHERIVLAAGEIDPDTLLRLAFSRYTLPRIAVALKAVEWNLSGDGDVAEDALLYQLVSDDDLRLAAQYLEAERLPYGLAALLGDHRYETGREVGVELADVRDEIVAQQAKRFPPGQPS